MRDVDLLVFRGYDDLAARILPGVADGLPQGKVTLHAAADAEGSIAVLVELPPKSKAPAGIPLLEARIDPATNAVAARSAPARALFRVLATETVDSLARAVKPVPHAAAPEPGHVMVWCADGAAFARLVGECLGLGCDRIRWTGLASERRGRVATGSAGATAASAGAVVARIDDPPWYLLERWTRPRPAANGAAAATSAIASAPVFALDGEDRLYTRWGYTHPLAGRMKIPEGEMLFVDAGGAILRFPDAAWRDLYDAISVSVDGLESARWKPADPAPRFQVKLSLVETSEPGEPELWLLSADDLPAVERLLGLMPEADLKHLAIAFFEPAPGAPAAALREVITGRGRGWVNFGGKGFRAHSGLPSLFLPVDRALDPLVRRDRIAAAFGLERGEIVVVEETGAAAAGSGRRGLRALRIAEPTFRPLTSYVDYIAAGDAAKLASMIATSAFDPGPLADLPSAAADAPRARPAREPRAAANPEPVLLETEDVEEAEAAPLLLVEPLDGESGAAEPSAPADDPRREHELESRIALDPPGSAVDWMALADTRLQRGDPDAAVECWENARWSDRALEPAARDRSIAALEGALKLGEREADPTKWPALARAIADGEGDVRTLRLRALYVEAGRHPETTLTPQFLEEMYADTRASIAAERVRKKTRWLVWRAVLSRTGDEIEAERQREQILADLNQDGLAAFDRTDFVRPRLAEQATGAAGGAGELQQSLEGLAARMAKIEEPRLRWIGISLLARRWAELDDIARATHLAGEAIEAARGPAPGLIARSAPVARILGNAAAALIRVGHTDGERVFRDALGIVAALPNGDEKGRTLATILEALSSTQNPKIATPLARAALPVLAEGDKRRAALNLQRCAAAFAKLDAGAEARALALSLAAEPVVAAEPHYLTGAVGSLALLARPRTLAGPELAMVVAAVERHQRDFEDVNWRLMEGAVSLAGEEFARRVSDRMRNTPPSEIKFPQLTYWACAIQGLAAARASDAGLEDLERALRLAWQLPNDDERRRCIKRLVGTASAFGRVGPGLSLVRDVVARCESGGGSGPGPYFKSEVLQASVDAIARLGDKQGAFDVMDRVIRLVEKTARESAGDVTFLFDVLGLCVDHAVALGAAGESAAIIKRVEGIVEEWMDESSARFWTPFYRFKALAKCGRGLARLGQEGPGLEILSRILDASNPRPGQPGTKLMGLDLIDLLKEIVRSLSEVGGRQRLDLVDRVLDAFLSEKSVIVGEAGAELMGMILDEVVSPASRVRAEYERFLGAEERSIRDRVAAENITGTESAARPPSGAFGAAPPRRAGS